jgi:hypothetical protein
MTDPLDAYGDALRRALHAEADSVVPSADGLERIRTRINERQRRFGWAWFTENWGRPAIALGAAMFIAAVALLSTPALHAIEGITAGDSNSADTGGPDHSVTNGPNIPGQPGQPGQPYPGGSTSGEPTSSPSPQESPRVGTPACAPPPSSGPSPSSTPAARSGQGACTTPPPAVATSPPDTPTSEPPEPTPTENSPASTSEPAPNPMNGEQNAPQTGQSGP